MISLSFLLPLPNICKVVSGRFLQRPWLPCCPHVICHFGLHFFCSYDSFCPPTSVPCSLSPSDTSITKLLYVILSEIISVISAFLTQPLSLIQLPALASTFLPLSPLLGPVTRLQRRLWINKPKAGIKASKSHAPANAIV